MTTLPLDVDDLLGELADPASEPFDGLPAGTVIGHVHLKVADIPRTIAFYRDTLGFALMAQLGGQAAFLAAGGYHHNLGADTWRAPAPRPLRPERRRFATRRSSSQTARNATKPSSACRPPVAD